ncbi:MAG: DUF1653 domain-containing protein [Lachnospiraceae bacterium]|nr:DUF1653 domain-containing protein [Lachnospiraceae bacterium]
MRHNPRPQEIYRHFKGNLYQIRCLARHSETGEMMVVYQAMYDTFEIYVRPLSLFMEEVDTVKYPDTGQKYRFALLENGQDSVKGQEGTEPEKAEPTDRAQEQQNQQNLQKQTEVKTVDESEELNIDPLVLEFLDADSYEQRLLILDSLHNRITDDMINTMAVSEDLEIKEGDLEDRYQELRNCLRTFEKFECNRLR